LRTIVRDPTTSRARDKKPGEDGATLWEEVSESTFHILTDVTYDNGDDDDDDKKRRHWNLFYNEADALEDAVIFPDELDSTEEVAKFRNISNTISQFISEGPEVSKWVYDLDIDDSDPGEPMSDDENEEWPDELDIDDSDSGEPMSDDENEEWSDEDSLADKPLRWNTGLGEVTANAILQDLGPGVTRRWKSVCSEDEQKANALIIKWINERHEMEGYEEEDMRTRWLEFMDRHKSARKLHVPNFLPCPDDANSDSLQAELPRSRYGTRSPTKV
jgi:hypothetical protein